MTTFRDAGWRVCAALFAVLFFALLLSLARFEHFPLPALAGLVLFGGLAARRPSTALLVLATLIPVAMWLGRRWEPSAAWAEALVVAFSAGYCARGAVMTRGERDELDLPILLGAAVIVASLIVQVLVDGWRFGGATVRDQLWLLVRQDYLRILRRRETRSIQPCDSWNRSSSSGPRRLLPARTRTFGPLLVRASVFGAAAAAAVNVLRLWEGALRLSSPLEVFVRYLLTQRFNAHYGDLNAAGSYFVLVVFPAMGLAVRQMWRWGPAALLIAVSLWIAGSRAAFVAGLVAMIVPAGVFVFRLSGAGPRRMTAVAAAIMLILVAVGMVRYLPTRRNQIEPSTALEVRWELARTSVRMLAAGPIFGAGIGRYYWRSGEFSSPRLLTIFPPAIHENAHNNFLQILAELGFVGLGAVIWLMIVAARACGRLVRADPRDPLRWGVAVGLLAFVISWLGGHPLLIDEPAFAFWLLLGTACGWAPASPPPASRALAWAAGALMLVVGLSVPVRTNSERADFNLEHRGIGLSAWQDELDGIRYRRAGSTSVVFVPSGSSVCVVPLRASPPSDDLKVEVWLDGHRADEVRVRSDLWLPLRLLLPKGADPPRFHRLEFRVSDPPAVETAILMIGKVQVR